MKQKNNMKTTEDNKGENFIIGPEIEEKVLNIRLSL
jgi:hypothetical protein